MTLPRRSDVKLASISEDQVDQLLPWHQDREFLALYDAVPAAPRSRHELVDNLKEWRESESDFAFGIELADKLVGVVCIEEILWNQGVGSVSIGIGDAAARGQGVGQTTMTLVLDFAFQELNLRRIGLTVFEYNEPAIALYERLGFQHEGTAREFLKRDGRTWHMLYYGLLRREWEANG